MTEHRHWRLSETKNDTMKKLGITFACDLLKKGKMGFRKVKLFKKTFKSQYKMDGPHQTEHTH